MNNLRILNQIPFKSLRRFSISSRNENSWIKLSPQVCLHDVPTKIYAGGLKKNSPVTLKASLFDENNKHFISNAHYLTNENGELDLEKMASVGGSYEGVFSQGLLTTLKPSPEEFPYLRLYRRNPTTPWKINISVHDGHNPIEDKSDSIITAEMERHLTSPGVKRIPIRIGRVRGTLYLPSGPGPHPGIIDMFGTAGGVMEFRAALMASRGFATLALAYFAYEDLPKSLQNNFELEYFEEAVNCLLSHENVIPDRCGIVCASKAVDFGLLMSIHLDKVKAVVSIGGSPVAFDSIITYKNKVLIEGIKMKVQHLTMDELGRVAPSLELLQEDAIENIAKIIPINEASPDTHYLFVAGDDDKWFCHLGLDLVKSSVKGTQIDENVETILYKGAGHIIEPPYSSLVYHSYMRYLPVENDEGEHVGSIPILWGGEPLSQCKAQEHLWNKMRSFLNYHVRDSSLYFQNYIKVK